MDRVRWIFSSRATNDQSVQIRSDTKRGHSKNIEISLHTRKEVDLAGKGQRSRSTTNTDSGMFFFVSHSASRTQTRATDELIVNSFLQRKVVRALDSSTRASVLS